MRLWQSRCRSTYTQAKATKKRKAVDTARAEAERLLAATQAAADAATQIVARVTQHTLYALDAAKRAQTAPTVRRAKILANKAVDEEQDAFAATKELAGPLAAAKTAAEDMATTLATAEHEAAYVKRTFGSIVNQKRASSRRTKESTTQSPMQRDLNHVWTAEQAVVKAAEQASQLTKGIHASHFVCARRIEPVASQITLAIESGARYDPGTRVVRGPDWYGNQHQR